MSAPTYKFSGDDNREAGKGSRTFTDYENPFAFNTETYAPSTAPKVDEREVGSATTYTSKVSTSPSGYKRHRCNAIIRGLAFVFTLATVLAILENKQTSDVLLADGLKYPVTITYHYAGAFRFFLYANALVSMYMLMLVVISAAMTKRGGASQPKRLMWPIFISNLVACCLLLLGFAAALAVQVVSSQGMGLYYHDIYYISWRPICSDFKQYCGVVDASLGLTALAFFTVVAGTCIDAYEIYLYRGYAL